MKLEQYDTIYFIGIGGIGMSALARWFVAKGLSVYGLWVNGSDPRDPGQYAKDEYDVNLQWTPASGTLKGLSLRLRYAYVSQHDPAKSSLDDLRVMVYYDPAL